MHQKQQEQGQLIKWNGIIIKGRTAKAEPEHIKTTASKIRPARRLQLQLPKSAGQFHHRSK